MFAEGTGPATESPGTSCRGGFGSSEGAPWGTAFPSSPSCVFFIYNIRVVLTEVLLSKQERMYPLG